ncbi:hypothetical protein QTI51_09675 [Variovorax sp. J22G73]|uniref:hypothetical protein n=1 Tax=unclassified Variovorax TaxID=663243 RepID=UPI002578C66F|nr:MULTISPECIES: hypothetical protein [unclassified Variovorax]MDM0006431.1 hypothetical protein [Variovorax sp. J22R203]MDM0097546.1 hypothetical protein [Variovorax sp. J22G73]
MTFLKYLLIFLGLLGTALTFPASPSSPFLIPCIVFVVIAVIGFALPKGRKGPQEPPSGPR